MYVSTLFIKSTNHRPAKLYRTTRLQTQKLIRQYKRLPQDSTFSSPAEEDTAPPALPRPAAVAEA